MLELAAVVDDRENPVKMEEDSPLALHSYELVNVVLASIHTAHFPNLIAFARQLSGGEIESQQTLMAYGHACVTPGLKNSLRKILKKKMKVIQSHRRSFYQDLNNSILYRFLQ